MKNNRNLIIVLIAIVVVGFGYMVLNQPDQRSVGQKISDAADALPDGLDKAGRQLESRTPGEKLKDAAHDVKEDIKH